LTDDNFSDDSAYNNLLSTGVSIYETSEKDGVSIYATEENWNLENYLRYLDCVKCNV
jgi:hypothetical protein